MFKRAIMKTTRMNYTKNTATPTRLGAGKQNSSAQPRQIQPMLRQLLIVAARAGNAHDITALLAKGGTDDGAALRAACVAGSVPCVRALCSRISYAPALNDYAGYMGCPYHAVVKMAIRTGDIEFLGWIVDEVIIPRWQPGYGAMTDVSDFISVGQYRVAEFFLGHGGYENGHMVPGKCGKRAKEDDVSRLKVAVFDDSLPQAERDGALRCLALLSAGGREFSTSKYLLAALADLKRRQNTTAQATTSPLGSATPRQTWVARLASWVL